ncbi:HNH endonuclease domain-containing protein [Tianweitania sp.]|uniref:HNH endonuclease domain-containing protein n=1 Tax=Tianweitania sp. TaxID=2021634 RepID=UPI0028A24471|nr:HNH endonuclease domain-containing protein [Tianweitania sp.]
MQPHQIISDCLHCRLRISSKAICIVEAITAVTATLPFSEVVDVDRLAGLFRNATQSYKFLFFKAILAAVHRSKQPVIAFDDLLADMIMGAWWPIAVSRLTIGNAAGNDLLTALVGAIGTAERIRLDRSEALIVSRAALKSGRKDTPLRYVPERLLEPWTGGSTEPIYAIARETVVLGDDWLKYFTANLPVVQGWVDNVWCSWVQARNPNVPVTLEKLSAINVRRSLSRQRAFFVRGIEQERLRCIYTDAPFGTNFHVDHFLPRSFVAHDRIWNLVPVAMNLNTSKGARIPDQIFVGALAQFHAMSLRAALANGEDGPLVEQYCLDLRLAPEHLVAPDALHEAYVSVVPAMMSIAARMGFPAGWRP